MLDKAIKLIAHAGGYLRARLGSNQVILEKLLLYTTSGQYILTHFLTLPPANLDRLLEYSRLVTEGKCRLYVSAMRDIPFVVRICDNIVEASCVDYMLLDLVDPRAEIALLGDDPLLEEKYIIPRLDTDDIKTLTSLTTVPVRIVVEECPNKPTVVKIYLPQIFNENLFTRVFGARFVGNLDDLAKLPNAELLHGLSCRSVIIDVLPSRVFSSFSYINLGVLP